MLRRFQIKNVILEQYPWLGAAKAFEKTALVDLGYL
jgi:hypothetical protein